TISYGYGLQATPLQVAAALSAVAMGGVGYPPFIVEKIVGADGQTAQTQPEGRPMLSQKAAHALGEMMEGGGEKGGTAPKRGGPGFVLAGKTGTAYKHDPVTKKYSSDKYLASFIGFAPADDPRVVIVVMVDEPSAGKHFGGDVAAPVFAVIASESLKYLGVAATEKVEAKPKEEVLEIDERAVREAVPDEEVPESSGMVV